MTIAQIPRAGGPSNRRDGSGPTQKRHRILVVDDEPAILRMNERLIRKDDREVVTALTRTEALDIYRKGGFDLVISDFHMPGMDGVQFLRELKKLNPTQKVIFISGGIGAEEVRKVMNEGAIDVIMKPFDSQVVKNKVTEALQRECAVEPLME
ncbi:MAG: response regulator [Candidatus Micrarchaeota archaeon]